MTIQWDFKEVNEFYNRLGDYSKFRKYMKRTARSLSKYMLQVLKQKTPRGKTGRLISGWDESSAIKVNPVKDGFKVTLYNRVPYASAVNNGHRSFNQYGGPYEVKKRIKVPSPYPWQENTSSWYVFGHFFVERAVIQVENSNVMENLIYEQLEQWWEEICNG